MPRLNVITRQGDRIEIDAPPGGTVMEAVVAGGVHELLAVCGGSLSCATCHVYVESGRAETLPQMSGDEDDLLDASLNRTDQSRLSCQLPFDETLDGLTVTVAPED